MVSAGDDTAYVLGRGHELFAYALRRIRQLEEFMLLITIDLQRYIV